MAEQPIMNFHIQGDNHVYPTAAVVNNYFGDTVSATAMKLNLSQNCSKDEDADDELRAILRDKETYDEVVRWAATCKQPKDIRARICEPLKKNGIREFSKDFIRALIPHLKEYEGSTKIETLQKYIY